MGQHATRPPPAQTAATFRPHGFCNSGSSITPINLRTKVHSSVLTRCWVKMSTADAVYMQSCNLEPTPERALPLLELIKVDQPVDLFYSSNRPRVDQLVDLWINKPTKG